MNTQRIVSLLLVFTLLVPTIALANEPNSCAQAGYAPIGGARYDYIANGYPYYDSCWYINNAAFTTGYTSCGFFTNYWEFNYAGSLTQTLVIPTSHTNTKHLTLYYQLDFEDPNHDGAWNRFTASVIDNTAGRQLGYEFYSGSSPSLSCSDRMIGMSSPVDLAGHSITVTFHGSRGYTNTHIRIRRIYLLQL